MEPRECVTLFSSRFGAARLACLLLRRALQRASAGSASLASVSKLPGTSAPLATRGKRRAGRSFRSRRQRNWRAANLVARTVSRARGMSSQKRPGGPAGAGPSKRQNMAEDEDEDMGFDEEEMLAMEEEMVDEAGQEDGPAPPDEEVASCLTKTQFAACAKQWTRPKVPPLDPATDEVTFQQSEVCRRRCRRQHRPSPPPPSPPPPSRPPPSLPPPQASR